jgi:hypothetical protein
MTDGSDDVIVGREGTTGRRQPLLYGMVEYYSSSIVHLEVYLARLGRSI